MGREIKGKRVLVTGTSSGIGRSLATNLVRDGAAVAMMARSAELLDELARDLTRKGGDVLAVPGDVTVAEDRTRALDAIRTRFGGLDLLINNAGIGGCGHFANSNEELLRRTMEVNFFGPVDLIRAAVPILKEGNQPAIVNVASMCGRRALPGWSEYSASKFALAGFTEALRGEMARFDIEVLLIVPGLTHSSLGEHLLRNETRMKIDYSKGMSADYVADRIIHAIRKNRRETVLGTEAKWMLRINRFFPRLVDRLISRKVKKLYADDPKTGTHQ